MCHVLLVCCNRLVGLPASTGFADLLGLKIAKKGAMKVSSTGAVGAGGATVTARMGHVRKLTTQHLKDGKPMNLEMQVGQVQDLQGLCRV